MRATSWGFKSPLAHLIGDPFRPHRRRRRRWLVPVVLTILIGLVVAFGLAVDRDATPPLFAENLRTALETAAAEATQFGAMVDGIGGVDRVSFDATVEETLSSLAEVRAVMSTAPSGDPALTAPLALLDVVVRSWETGLSSFRDLVFIAADDPLAVGVEIDITDALIDLRAGDRLYQSFVTAIDAADTPAAVAPFPVVAFVSETYPFSTGPAHIVSVARAEGNLLALRAEVAIEQVATEPPTVVNTSDDRVVTVTDSLAVRVVVLNRGNTESDPSQLSLSLAGNDETSISLTGEVPAIQAAGQTTVLFEALDVSPGITYLLTVQLPLAEGEEESEDNLVQWAFLVNEETGSTTTTEG